MTPEEITPEELEERQRKMAELINIEVGYETALHDYGIWNNGVQTIGCLSRPIKEIIAERREKLSKETSALFGIRGKSELDSKEVNRQSE